MQKSTISFLCVSILFATKRQFVAATIRTTTLFIRPAFVIDAMPKTARKSRTSATSPASASVHPYFKARKSNASSSSSSSSPPTKSTTKTTRQTRKVFCDLDGVLCDFEGKIKEIFKRDADSIHPGRLWATVARTDRFFETLNWTCDGEELWNAIKHLTPDILTGIPNNKKAAEQKYNWCKAHLGCKVNNLLMAASKPQRHEVVTGSRSDSVTNIISCWSKFKYQECIVPGDILIDDRLKLKEAWEDAGGNFVHHTNTTDTLRQLRDLGVIGNE